MYLRYILKVSSPPLRFCFETTYIESWYRLAQAKADLRLTLLSEKKKKMDLLKSRVDLAKSLIELRLLKRKEREGAQDASAD